MVKQGASFGFGLESGSKPELILALAALASQPREGALLICNGYKVPTPRSFTTIDG